MSSAKRFQLTAPQGGLTCPEFLLIHATAYFNSQPHKGADVVYFFLAVQAADISTHSPARGLTVIEGNIRI